MIKINPNIFRGYDLRGVAGSDLNPEIVESIGKGYGAFLSKSGIHKAVVGRDCRLTGQEYSEALIKGLVWTGIDVIDIGLTLAGTLYWAQYYLNCPGGALVSASHNPPEYNGFKFATGFSETMGGQTIQELRRIIESEDFVQADRPGKLETQDISAAYIDDIASRFNLTKKFKVVVDASCATAGLFSPALLRKTGCEVIEKNCVPDGNFPLGTPDPTEKAVAERLSLEVKQAGADIGFTYDADGDRLGVVDENGGILWNDILVALFAADVLEKNPGAKIVFNTLCSKVVQDTILAKGGESIMCKTGHSFIKAKAKEIGAKFGGELSGHFFFLDKFYGHDDGCYGTLRLLDYLDKTGQSLSEAVGVLPKYISSPEIKIGCSDDLKVGLLVKVADVLRRDFKEAEVIDDAERAGDGARLEMPEAMFVIRYSQNGPYLTVKFEAKTESRYNELKEYINKLLRSYPEVDWSFGVNMESLK
ncbi:MAG: phosphomannomutase/phosphoglucomutase [Patescibacteria group bacterium]